MIAVYGSLNADLIFEVSKVPAPGQTVLASGFRTEAGGKGANQAIAAARDGAEVAMIGAVGNDALSHAALENFSSSGADTSRVVVLPHPTGCASIIVNEAGQNQITVSPGANMGASADQVEHSLLDRASLLLLQMECAPADVKTLLERAATANVRAILNLAPAIRLDADKLRLCDYLVVNEDEAETVAGWLGCGSDAASLHRALGTGVIRTLGSAGAEAMDADGYCSVPAYAISPVDTTAAGDCFIGVLAAALDRGEPLETAMARATAAAALACLTRGSQSSLPWRADTDRFLSETAPNETTRSPYALVENI